MYYIEQGSFCSLSEYENGFSKRLAETQLAPEELYMAKLALGQNPKNHEAAKVPLRVIKPAEFHQNIGAFLIVVRFLDQDLQPTSAKGVLFKDGAWHRPTDDGWNIGGIPISSGYIQHYGDGLGTNYSQLFKQLDLVAT